MAQQLWRALEPPASLGLRRLFDDPIQLLRDRITGLEADIAQFNRQLAQMNAVPEHQRASNWRQARIRIEMQREDAQAALERARQELGSATGSGETPPRRTPTRGASNPASRSNQNIGQRVGQMIADMEEDLRAIGDARQAFIENAVQRLPPGATQAQVEQVRELAAALYDAKERENDFNQAMEDGAQIYEQTRTSQERLRDELANISYLYQIGAIDAQTYSRAVAQAYDKSGDALAGLKDELVSAGQEVSKMLAGWAVGIEQTNFSIGRLIQTLASGIIQKLIQSQIVNPLAEVGSQFLTQYLGPLFGRTAAQVPALSGGGSYSTPIKHGGGIGWEGGATRQAPVAAFFGAPRFHGGRLPWGAGEMPAILRRDEGVFTPGQMAALGRGGGDVEINLYDQRGAGAAPVETRSSNGPNGQRMIDIFIRDRVSQQADNGGLDAALGRNFGLARTPTRRS